MKAFIVGGNISYGRWLTNDIVNTIEEADLIIFTGGEDVDPNFYGEIPNRYTHYNTDRDLKELLYFNKAVKLNKSMLGICRGNQFLCMANNGKIIQNVSNHGISKTHPIIDLETKEVVDITSTHHQMIYPFDLSKEDYNIIASSKDRRSDYYIKDTDNNQYNEEEVIVEPEIIYYPKTHCLGIQGHPEYMDKNSPAVIYCKKLINQYLLPKELHLKIDEVIVKEPVEEEITVKYDTFDVESLRHALINLEIKRNLPFIDEEENDDEEELLQF